LVRYSSKHRAAKTARTPQLWKFFARRRNHRLGYSL
jgi:hypothetical protein